MSDNELVIVKVGLNVGRKMSDDLYGSFMKDIYLEVEGQLNQEELAEKLDSLNAWAEDYISEKVFKWAQDPETRKQAETIKNPPVNPANVGSGAPVAPYEGRVLPSGTSMGMVPSGPPPPAEPYIASPSGGPAQTDDMEEIVTVQAMRVWNLPNGGKGVKMVGGPWTEYGVTTYPEVLETISFNPNQMNPGDYQPPFPNMRAVVQMKWKDNKKIPDKVTAFLY